MPIFVSIRKAKAMTLETVATPHPFRTIVLDYNREIAPQDFEKETLADYFYMHDKVWQLKTMREQLESLLDDATVQIDTLRAEIYPIEQEIDLLELVTGLREDNPVPGFDGSMSIQIDHFKIATHQHNEDLMVLYELIDRHTEEHNAFLDEFNPFEEWFEAFAEGPMHELYQRYEELSVDIVSVDVDHQSFLEAWSPIIYAEREYFDRAQRTFEAYVELVELSNALYRKAERLDAALDEFLEKHKDGVKSGWKRFKE